MEKIMYCFHYSLLHKITSEVHLNRCFRKKPNLQLYLTCQLRNAHPTPHKTSRECTAHATFYLLFTKYFVHIYYIEKILHFVSQLGRVCVSEFVLPSVFPLPSSSLYFPISLGNTKWIQIVNWMFIHNCVCPQRLLYCYGMQVVYLYVSLYVAEVRTNIHFWLVQREKVVE